MLREEDLEVTVERADNPSANSRVVVEHKPTGIIVSCDTYRSPVANKWQCLKQLVVLLHERNEAAAQEYVRNKQRFGTDE